MLIKGDLGKIEGVASKENTGRWGTQNLYLDVEKKRLVGTDGHMLAVLPIEPSQHDTTGPVPKEAITEARKLARKHHALAEVSANGTVKVEFGSLCTEMPRPENKQFINYETVCGKPEGRPTIVLNPKFLLAIYQAITDGYNDGIALWITDPLKPVYCQVGRNNEAFGVLMPMQY